MAAVGRLLQLMTNGGGSGKHPLTVLKEADQQQRHRLGSVACHQQISHLPGGANSGMIHLSC
jgi:hypothetical protein